MVLDEFGSLEGMVTPTDIMEAIAGEFVDEHDEQLTVEHGADGSILVDGWIDIRQVSKVLDVDLVDETDRYSTLAGLILWRLGHLPQAGEIVPLGDLTFEVVKLDGRHIDKVRIIKTADANLG
jgi:CBS domain containing-hemolysin-like protein